MASLKKLLDFLFVLENFTCYVFNSRLTIRDENDFLPKTNNFTLHIVSAKTELDGLVKNGFDFSAQFTKAEHRLKKGAVACLIFVNKEIASIEWVATNPEAKASIDIYPCKVNYSNKEAYAGGVWTNPKYRGNGLHLYAYYKIYDFLREKGIETVKSIVEINNSAALKSHERFAPEEKIEAKAHYLRAMGLHFWKEKPIKTISRDGQR